MRDEADPEDSIRAVGDRRRAAAGWKVSAVALTAILAAVVLLARPADEAAAPDASGLSGGAIPSPVTAVASPGPSASADPRADGPDSLQRYDDGIPAEWAGRPVLRLAAALDADPSALRGSFLLGAWSDGRCTAASTDGPRSPCSQVRLGDDPAGAIRDDLRLRPTTELTIPTGPVILRVQFVAPRRDCVAGRGQQCPRIVSVDEVAWSGDGWTDAQPIPVDAALAALGEPYPALSVVPFREMAACRTDWPSQTWRTVGTSPVRIVAVFPSEELRAGAELSARTAGAPREPGEGECVLALDRRLTLRASWVAVANVMVLVGGERSDARAVADALRGVTGGPG